MIYEYARDKTEYFSIGRCPCGRHFHRAIEILCCLEKPKTVIVSGERMTVDEGDVLFLSPCTEHIFPIIEGHLSVCAVLPVAYTEIWNRNTGGKHLADPIIRDKELARDIREHILKLRNCKNQLLKSGIYSYVLGLVMSSSELVEQTGYSDEMFAMQTLEYLEKNYMRNITLDEAARTLGYNRCYFSTLFNKNFHTSFRGYLNAMRIERSVGLLGRLPISEVAAAVGYESIQVFYHNFQKMMGCTPGKYVTEIKSI